jgi:sulfatase maturation enzyme AslB (radical SAM superfamily)
MSDGSNKLNGRLKKIKKASSKLLESLLAIKNKNGEKHIFVFGKGLKIKNLFTPVLLFRSLVEKERKLYFCPNYFGNIEQMEFHITNKCNYKCEYCNAGCGNDKNDGAMEASKETTRNFIGLLPKIKNKSWIKIIGGEPILHPMFFEVAEEIIKNRHILEIATNFSLPNKNFERVCDLIEDGEGGN